MVIKREVWYPPTESMRMLHIYLPDEYPYTEERYPVMYFFDGHNLFSDQDATYGKSWGMKSFLEKGAMPQLYCQLGGGHCEADWEKLVPVFMDFLWK